MEKIRLDNYEQEIEDAFESYVPLAGEKLEKVERALAIAKKNRSINIRISEYDLARVKERSLQEGLPYQTFISSVIHRYLNGTLVDENAVRQSLRLLNS
jgi:predicted DNA binding CopG/RHH family protein